VNDLSTVHVVGSIHMDVVVNVERFPVPGETFRGTKWGFRPGGKGRNQAVSAANHSKPVRMWGAVGTDQFGPALLDSLVSAGVDTSGVVALEGASSGGSVALLAPDGDSESVIISEVNLRIPSDLVDRFASAVRAGDVVVLQNEISPSANEQVAQATCAAGSTVILNAAPFLPVTQSFKKAVDILVVNEVEASEYLGHAITNENAALSSIGVLKEDWNCDQVIITLGSRGVVYQSRNELPEWISPVPVDSSDAHGAGDAFVGALAAELQRQSPFAEAVRYANATAAATIVTPFERRHLITREQVRELISSSDT
jgi:ribokinase